MLVTVPEGNPVNTWAKREAESYYPDTQTVFCYSLALFLYVSHTVIGFVAVTCTIPFYAG